MRLRGRRLSMLLASLLLLGVGAGPAVSVAGSYRIGTDDVLAISVWDQRDLDQVVFVRPDGKISLALVGEVEAVGRTVAELAEQLTELYRRTIRGALVTVTVREIRSRPVFFVGGVARPGPIQLTQDLTLLQAISAAGGLLPAADLESIYVIRGSTRIPVDLARMLQRGDVTQNLLLQPGDTIVVPLAESVFVQGEVRTPGPVKYTRDLTVLKAIAAAGGFTPMAAPRRISVVRGEGLKKETFRVNANEIMSDPNATDVPLKPNDIIIVPQRLF